MPLAQNPKKIANNNQARSSRRGIQCRDHANTAPQPEKLRPRIGPKGIDRSAYHYANLVMGRACSNRCSYLNATRIRVTHRRAEEKVTSKTSEWGRSTMSPAPC